MIDLSPFVRSIIVQRFAATGRMCRTAELIFLGNPNPPKGRVKGNWYHDSTRTEAPGAYGADLVSECNTARALFLARAA